MSKPIIAITCRSMERGDDPLGRLVLDRKYADRVQEAGGIPIVIPPDTEVEALAGLIDGLIIPGGDDLDAGLWGEPNHPDVKNEDPRRTKTELRLMRALPKSAPVLGICYGCQLINVAHGGSLIQHLPDRLGDDRHRGDSWQRYQVDVQSRLGKIIGDHAEGKSWHHQAVDRVGENLRVTAHHEDGTIEALESTEDRWLVGVQWHPERSEDSAATPLLFAAFIEACAEYRRARLAEAVTA